MKLMGMDDNDVDVGDMNYTSIGFDKLGASAYTLVGIVVDETGSVTGHKKDLEDMLDASLESCRVSPRVMNLLVRSTAFHYDRTGEIRELHGFELINSLDTKKFKGTIKPYGSTNLYDATEEMCNAVYDYGKKLKDKHYTCNTIIFIITDGEDNGSKTTLTALASHLAKIRRDESLFEDFTIILIGVNDTICKPYLENFKDKAKLDKYVSVGDVTGPDGQKKLNKVAGFMSESISSHSVAIQTGTPSQPIDLTF